jgi:hypothetical protein
MPKAEVHLGNVGLWLLDLETGKTLHRFNGHSNEGIVYLGVAASGRRAVTVGADKTMRVWGLPMPSGAAPRPKYVSLRALTKQELFVQHRDHLGCVREAVAEGDRQNATFELTPGLAGPDSVSFRSVNLPDHYLAHGSFRFRLQRFEDTETFRKNASFRIRKGLAKKEWSSFEAVNWPGHFMRTRNGELHLDRLDGSAIFRIEATFLLSEPLYVPRR